LKAAEASLANLRVQLDNDSLQLEATTASIEADYQKAKLQTEVNTQLLEKQLIAAIIVKQSRLDAEQLEARLTIAKKQLASRSESSVRSGALTVDVAMSGRLPKGSRPALSGDGTIERWRLPDVLFVGRPAFGQEQSTVGLFRLQSDGTAARTPVTLGRSSVNTV